MTEGDGNGDEIERPLSALTKVATQSTEALLAIAAGGLATPGSTDVGAPTTPGSADDDDKLAMKARKEAALDRAVELFGPDVAD